MSYGMGADTAARAVGVQDAQIQAVGTQSEGTSSAGTSSAGTWSAGTSSAGTSSAGTSSAGTSSVLAPVGGMSVRMKAMGMRAVTGNRRRLAGFGRDESGTLVIFALMLTVMMMMMGGIAVDLMRYESRRTSLQNTLDRSTLAAAALTQDLVPRAVVDDYFRKAGLLNYLTSVTVTHGWPPE